MTEAAIPVGFRAETLQQVMRLLRAGESCALVGVGSAGKSNVARHLARPDVRREYFGPAAEAAVVVYLNCKPFALRAPAEFYLHTLDQLARSVEAENGGPALLASQRDALRALWQAAQGDPSTLARRNLDEGLGALARAGAQHLVLVLDDCDDLFRQAPPVFFSDLRALRDNYKVKLVYVTLTRREPVFLRDDAPEYEELFELLSAPGHTLPIGPYVESDALLMLRRLAARQSPPRDLSEAEARQLVALGGGHAGLLRSLFFAVHYNPELAAASQGGDWPRLAEHTDVEAEARKIWDSLEPDEQNDLRRIALGQAPSEDGLRRLARRGLARPHPDRPTEIFSPIFERCLYAILGLEAPGPARPRVEFLGPNQARVDGRLVTDLLPPEAEILRCLHLAAPEPASRLALVDAMRQGELRLPTRKPHGDPLRRLDEYLRQLRAKLGHAGERLRPAGDGYRLE